MLNLLEQNVKSIKQTIFYKYKSNENLVTYEEYKFLLANKYIWISLIPKNILNMELCELAVLTEPDQFRNIPCKFRTEKLCEIAVAHNTYFLWYVPMELHTEKICKIAVNSFFKHTYYSLYDSLIYCISYNVPETCAEYIKVILEKELIAQGKYDIFKKIYEEAS